MPPQIKEPTGLPVDPVHCDIPFLVALESVAASKGEAVFGTWYDEKGQEESRWTFGGLWNAAGEIAYMLHHDLGVKKGERAVLCYLPGKHFFSAFLGCLRAGVVPVLTYPPNPASLERDLTKLAKVVENCQPALFLVDSQVSKLRTLGRLNVFSRTRAMWPNLPFHRTDQQSAGADSAYSNSRSFDEEGLQPSDLAFLQYTSGSTGDPKGVMVTFKNIASNVSMTLAGMRVIGTGEEGFSWLPQYHDMGLIYSLLAPLCAGFTMHYMSPVTFIRRPLLWLELMARKRCTWTVAPDFGYNLCARKYAEAANPKPQWDLSCIKSLQSAAEPIRLSTVRAFDACFKHMGLPDNWFTGGYGLAEAVAAVVGTRGLYLSKANPSLVCAGTLSFLMALGGDADIRVVDPETFVEKPRGQTGELWLHSEAVTAGYYGKPEATREVFNQRVKGLEGGLTSKLYLRTGDLAYWEDDKLYICGRMKDVIICRGRNIYPQVNLNPSSLLPALHSSHQDIELAAQEATSAVRPGCVAAFSSSESAADELVVVFEIRSVHAADAAAVVQEVRAAVFSACGVSAARVVAIAERSILKTTSGKIRRRATRDALRAGSLQEVHAEVFEVPLLEITPLDPEDSSAPVTPDSETSPLSSDKSELPLETESESDLDLAESVRALPSSSSSSSKSNSSSGSSSSGGSELALAVSKQERVEFLEKMLLELSRQTLSTEVADHVLLDQPLMEAGLSSITMVEFLGHLQQKVEGFGVQVPSTVIFDHPTLRALASYVEAYSAVTLEGESRGMVGMPSVASSEPAAIVSMACRLPGSSRGPEQLWDLLSGGGNGVVEVPATRWDVNAFYDSDPLAAGKTYARAGGFVDGVEKFDNAFFGVSAAEAGCMDPQQRLLLEVGYEALHNAGYNKETLSGSKVGVFVGACTNDWSQLRPPSAGNVGAFTGTGGAASILSNRLSYLLGLHGPSMTIDTACSSSLVALHLAIQSLQSGECIAALVLGVNLLLSPHTFEVFSKTRMLSPHSRCATFDASADGYARGEGCGAVVLKRLDGLAEGDSTLAVVRGSAVTHNGRSATMTAPNGVSQQMAVTQALTQAGVSAAEVSYVEAHGTGTALGDPIEMGALKAVYGQDRSVDNPLVVGAVKTNIGHLEGAAGIAGLIKAVLVLQHQAAPPNLHFSKLNLAIDVEDFAVAFPAEGGLTALPGSAGLAGVSSFGFGGANAHVVLERREPLPAAAAPVQANVGFLFTGQGSQYPGMGRELYEQRAVFHDCVDLCDEVLRERGLLDRSVVELMYPTAEEEARAAGLLEQTRYCQPCLFVLEYALAALWKSEGIVPKVVMGHSLGELVAACVAGVMSLEHALLLATRRGAAMQSCPEGEGIMLAVRTSSTEAAACIEACGVSDKVVVASDNGRHVCVISGAKTAMEQVTEQLRVKEVAFKPLDVSHAFHSPLMQPAAAAVEAALGEVDLHPPKVLLVSNVTGSVAKDEDLVQPQYWIKHMMSPVMFSQGVESLLDELVNAGAKGSVSVVEVGPSPVLTNMGKRVNEEGMKERVSWLACMKQGQNSCSMFDKALDGVLKAASGQMSWEHKSFPWQAPEPAAASGTGAVALTAAQQKRLQLLADPVDEALYSTEWETVCSGPATATPALASSHDGERWLLYQEDESGQAAGALAAELRNVLQLMGVTLIRGAAAEDVQRIVVVSPAQEEVSRLAAAAKQAAAGEMPLLVVTQGIHSGDAERAAWRNAWVRGFLRSARLELFGLLADHLDLPPASETEASPTSLLGSLALGLKFVLEHDCSGADVAVATAEGSEGRLQLQVKTAQVVRAADLKWGGASSGGHKLSGGTYIITGGLGALGLRAAHVLASKGAAKLLLLSRSGKVMPDNQDLWEALQQRQEVESRAVVCDVSQRDSLASVLEGALEGIPAVKGVIHAAGVLGKHSKLHEVTAEALRDLLKPKIEGGWNLHSISEEKQWKLDFFIGYSSTSSLLGLGGHAAYGAANAALDGLMSHRRSLGLKATSLQWGAWSSGGMAQSQDSAAAEGSKSKSLTLPENSLVSPELGARVLEAAVGLSVEASVPSLAPSELAVMPAMDWAKYASFTLQHKNLCLMKLLTEEKEGLAAAAAAVPKGSKLAENALGGTDPAGLSADLCALAGSVSSNPMDGMDTDGQLAEMMDSLELLEFFHRTNQALQLQGRKPLPSTALLECGTVNGLVQAIIQGLGEGPEGEGGLKAGGKGQLVDVGVNGVDVSAVDDDGAVKSASVAVARKAAPGGADRNRGAASSGKAGGKSLVTEECESHEDNIIWLLMSEAFPVVVVHMVMAVVTLAPCWVVLQLAKEVYPLIAPVVTVSVKSGVTVTKTYHGMAAAATGLVMIPIFWLLWAFLMLATIVIVKRALVGHGKNSSIKAGTSFEVGSFLYWRWYLVQRLLVLPQFLLLDDLRHTRFIVWYMRACGADIGRDVSMNTFSVSDMDSVRIGEGSVVNENAVISGHSRSGTTVTVQGVDIGSCCVLMPSAVVDCGATVPDRSCVESVSEVNRSRSTGQGSSLRHDVVGEVPLKHEPLPLSRVAGLVMTDLLAVYCTTLAVAAAAYPAFRLLSWLLEAEGSYPSSATELTAQMPRLEDSQLAFFCVAFGLLSKSYLPFILVFLSLSPSLVFEAVSHLNLTPTIASASVAFVVFAVCHMGVSVIMKWCIVGRQTRTGRIDVLSSLGVRKTVVDRIIISGYMRSVWFFNANYINIVWLRALGGNIGDRVSVMLNRNVYVDCDLLTLGTDTHIGFGSSTFCSVRVSPREFILEQTIAGKRAMAGVGSVMMPGCVLSDDAALGPNACVQKGPVGRGLHLGAPSAIPIREYSSTPHALTFLEQLMYYGLPWPCAVLAAACYLDSCYWVMLAVSNISNQRGNTYSLLCTPLLWQAFMLLSMLTSIVVKWVAIGRQHATSKGRQLWSWYYYRTIFNGYVYNTSILLFYPYLGGGPVYAAYLRLMGANIGARACIDSYYITDHDLVNIGEDAVVEEQCTPHPQFYLNGKLHFKPITIGVGAVAGRRSILMGGGSHSAGKLPSLGIVAAK